MQPRMQPGKAFEFLFKAAAIALAFLIPLSFAEGQSGARSGARIAGFAGNAKSPSAFMKQGPRFPGKITSNRGSLPSDAELIPLMNKDFPITVVPGGVGFDSLQDALDYCGLQSAKGGKGNKTSRMTIIIQAGTSLIGNWTLPTNGITIVGIGGFMAVSLWGKPGVNAPVITYAPNTGSTRSYASIRGVWIFGREDAAIAYDGNNSYSALWLERCQLGTEKSFPAIRVSGSGYDSDKVMSLEVEHSGIESEGDGVSCSINQHVYSVFLDASIRAKSNCFDVTSTAQGQNDFNFVFSYLFGEGSGSSGIKADNIWHLYMGYSVIDTEGTGLDAANVADIGLLYDDFTAFNADTSVFSNCPYARIQYSKLSSEATGTRCIKLLNGSEGRLSFLSLNSDISAGKANAVYKDGTSSWTAVYNQWREEPWP